MIIEEPCDPSEVVAAIVAYRGGWSLTGGSAKEDVLQTLRAFVEDWADLGLRLRVDTEDGPADLTTDLPVGLEYHPPRYAIHEVGGQQVAVASYFERGIINSDGQVWRYVVRAWRVKDGAVVDPTGTSLPQPMEFGPGQ